ncbi:MAG: T9SS type A sorting domain-containing protein [Tannerella sp.]|jgi:hypothetical protein|nr:T9SS type A sorting domain-containing protein [Tannerella sp.]
MKYRIVLFALFVAVCSGYAQEFRPTEKAFTGIPANWRILDEPVASEPLSLENGGTARLVHSEESKKYLIPANVDVATLQLINSDQPFVGFQGDPNAWLPPAYSQLQGYGALTGREFVQIDVAGIWHKRSVANWTTVTNHKTLTVQRLHDPHILIDDQTTAKPLLSHWKAQWQQGNKLQDGQIYAVGKVTVRVDDAFLFTRLYKGGLADANEIGRNQYQYDIDGEGDYVLMSTDGWNDCYACFSVTFGEEPDDSDDEPDDNSGDDSGDEPDDDSGDDSGDDSETATADIDKLHFKLYPNPVHAGQKITIESEAEIHFMEIISVTGQNVVQQTGGNALSIQVTAPHANGIYLIKIQTVDKKVQIRKIIVQ